jgi:hydrogenase nickel incorporation protein HypA/HybF
MHELPVTENILEISLRHANEAQADRVTDIHVVIGRLSSLVDDSIQFYWDIISDGTICKGAQLHFRRTPAKILCLNCASDYELEGELTLCPNCGSAHVKVVSGDEFWLESIEIEKDLKENT